MPDYHVSHRCRLYRLGLAVSYFLNVLILNGSEDHTLSGHIGHLADCYPRKRHWRYAKAVINWLFFWQYDHCTQCIDHDRARR